MYFIGVDGGGTKTEFTAINENNEVLCQVVKSTCHPNQVGYDGLKEIISSGLNELLNKLNITKDDIDGMCLGLAGYGRVKSIVEQMDKAMDEVLGNIPYIMKNDVEIALAGALAGQDGVVIIAGTGSIGLSLNNGKYTRTGGFGYTIGDEGSAYWIGRRVLEYFSKAADGRLEKTELYNIVKSELDLKDDYDIIYYVNEVIKANRTEVAKLAKLCSDAVALGDSYAKEIFNRASIELAEMANNLLKDFNYDNIPVSYIGGVFKSGSIVLNPFHSNLNKKVNLVPPKYQPSIGAGILAKSIIK